jgi:hypothetical protein
MEQEQQEQEMMAMGEQEAMMEEGVMPNDMPYM